MQEAIRVSAGFVDRVEDAGADGELVIMIAEMHGADLFDAKLRGYERVAESHPAWRTQDEGYENGEGGWRTKERAAIAYCLRRGLNMNVNYNLKG